MKFTKQLFTKIKNLPQILNAPTIQTAYAPKAWRSLTGQICVYKPAETSLRQVCFAIKENLCRDLNSMKQRTPTSDVQIHIGDYNEYSVSVVENIADNVLVTGPAYEPNFIKLWPVNPLGRHTSGVMILGINKGIRTAFRMRNSGNLSTFEISGKFGYSTENNFKDSILTAKSTYNHVHPGKISSVLAAMQATHQRQMFEMMGIDLQSEAAYDLACKGIIKPVEKGNPVIYSIKLIEFKRPKFTIEVNAINATEQYLCDLIPTIALEVRSVAHCTAIRHTKFGHFGVNDALLRGQWRLQDVFSNMALCREKFYVHTKMLSDEDESPVMSLDDESQTEDVETKD